MILNDEQKAVLDGKYGEGAAYAMKIQVGIGECFDAQRMVPIKRAHVALSNQDGDLWFAEKLVKAGARCRVAPTLNPGFCTGHFTGACAHPADAEDIAHMIRTDNAYRALGAVLSYNCTPLHRHQCAELRRGLRVLRIQCHAVRQRRLGRALQPRERQQRTVRRHHRLRARIRSAAR